MSSAIRSPLSDLRYQSSAKSPLSFFSSPATSYQLFANALQASFEISIDTPSLKNIIEYMKTITVNVSDPIYRDFTVYAKQVGNSASELIRRAMEDYHQRFILRKTTLRNRRPASVGGPMQPVGREEDLLGEMLDDSLD